MFKNIRRSRWIDWKVKKPTLTTTTIPVILLLAVTSISIAGASSSTPKTDNGNGSAIGNEINISSNSMTTTTTYRDKVMSAFMSISEKQSQKQQHQIYANIQNRNNYNKSGHQLSDDYNGSSTATKVSKVVATSDIEVSMFDTTTSPKRDNDNIGPRVNSNNNNNNVIAGIPSPRSSRSLFAPPSVRGEALDDFPYRINISNQQNEFNGSAGTATSTATTDILNSDTAIKSQSQSSAAMAATSTSKLSSSPSSSSQYFERVELLESSLSLNEKLLLHRRKRYLLFPEGSSFQMVFDLIIGMVDYSSYAILGITGAVAWELPSKFPSEIIEDFQTKLNDGTYGLQRRNDSTAEGDLQYVNTDNGKPPANEINQVPPISTPAAVMMNPTVSIVTPSLLTSARLAPAAAATSTAAVVRLAVPMSVPISGSIPYYSPVTYPLPTLNPYHAAMQGDMVQMSAPNQPPVYYRHPTDQHNYMTNFRPSLPGSNDNTNGQRHQQPMATQHYPQHSPYSYSQVPARLRETVNSTNAFNNWSNRGNTGNYQNGRKRQNYHSNAYAAYAAGQSAKEGQPARSTWKTNNWWDTNKQRVQEQWKEKQRDWSTNYHRHDSSPHLRSVASNRSPTVSKPKARQLTLPNVLTEPSPTAPAPAQALPVTLAKSQAHKPPGIRAPTDSYTHRKRKILKEPPKHRIYHLFQKRRRRRRRDASDTFENKLEQIHLHEHLQSRQKLYKKIEKFYQIYGHNGTACTLRALCETGQRQYHRHKRNHRQQQHKHKEPQSFIMELLRAIFVLPKMDDLHADETTAETMKTSEANDGNSDSEELHRKLKAKKWSDHISRHYLEAHATEPYAYDCSMEYPMCNHSIWDDDFQF